MKRARPLEHALLSALRRARRRSPMLAKEDRQARKRKHSRLLAALVPAWFVLPISFLALGGRAEVGLALLAVYAMATSLVRAGELRDDLRSGPDVAVAAALPATDDDLLEAAWWRFCKASLWILAPLSAAAFVAILPAWNESSFHHRLAVVFVIAIIGWSALVSLASLFATFEGPWPTLGLALHAATFATLLFSGRLPHDLAAQAWTALALTPGGWIGAAFEATRNGQRLRTLLLCIPLALLAATLPYSIRRLRRAHRIREVAVAQGHFAYAVFEGDAEQPALDSSDAQPLARADVAGALLIDWNTPLERAVALTLDSRERAVAEFLLGAQPSWTANWKLGLSAGAMAVIAAAILPAGWSWLVVLAGMVGTGALVPVLGGRWPAFDTKAMSSQFSTLVALHPVGFGEAARVILKANAIRIAFALPVVLACGAATLHLLGTGPTTSVLCMKLLGLIVCVQPVTVVAKFSSGSDDSNSRALAVIAATLPFLLPAVGLVLFGSHLAASLGLVLAAVSSAALMAGYGVVYGASRFDALRSTAE